MRLLTKIYNLACASSFASASNSSSLRLRWIVTSLGVRIELQELAASKVFVFQIYLRPARLVLARVRIVFLIEVVFFCVLVLNHFEALPTFSGGIFD